MKQTAACLRWGLGKEQSKAEEKEELKTLWDSGVCVKITEWGLAVAKTHYTYIFGK